MYKKVSGYVEKQESDVVKSQVLNNRDDFFATLEQLKGKKQEYKQIKDKRQKRMKDQEKEEKNVQMFKFGKMKKKDPFLNTVKKKGFFQKETDIVPVHEPARDYREREALIFPDKVKNNSKKWEYQGHRLDYFNKMAGREIDEFDDEKVKFFNEPTRTLGATKVTVTKHNPDGTIAKEVQSVKWNATKFRLDEIDHVAPLIDNTLTPRGREKAISLERNYEKKKKWIPNNFTGNEFKQEQKKSALLK